MKKVAMIFLLAILAITGKVSCQTFADTLVTLTAQGKVAEEKLIALAIEKTKEVTSTIGTSPAIIWEDNSITVKITFTNLEYKTPTTFMLIKEDKIFFDANCDGLLDVYYSSSKPMGDHQKMVAQLVARTGEVSQTEVDLSDLMQQNSDKPPFTLHNFSTNMFYSTDPDRAKGIMPIPSDFINKSLKKYQEKFLETMK